MTVVMKIDLVGPERRGLALGLNEAAGYGGVALAAGAQRLARRRVRRRATCSSSPARRSRVDRACCCRCSSSATPPPTSRSSRRAHHDADERPRRRCARRSPDATYREPALRSCSQAGLVNNLNDALAWGLVPLFLAAHGAERRRDRPRRRALPGGLGRRPDRDRPLVGPRRAQAADRRRHARPGRRARRCSPLSDGARRRRRGGRGRCSALGTALVYPTLIAAISDAVSPGRARAGRRRLPLLARHGLRRSAA